MRQFRSFHSTALSGSGDGVQQFLGPYRVNGDAVGGESTLSGCGSTCDPNARCMRQMRTLPTPKTCFLGFGPHSGDLDDFDHEGDPEGDEGAEAHQERGLVPCLLYTSDA